MQDLSSITVRTNIGNERWLFFRYTATPSTEKPEQPETETVDVVLFACCQRLVAGDLLSVRSECIEPLCKRTQATAMFLWKNAFIG